jgi:serine/threonine protein kinase/DNA-directed RNA polymerase subunit RPC12/RpoP
MIAYTCVHCGERMTVTEDDGTRKATCRKCGEVLSMSGVTAVRRRTAALSGARGGTTAILPARAPSLFPDPEDSFDAGSSPAIEESPTRSEAVASNSNLTGFLSPAQLPDEIGRLGRYRVLEVLGAGGMGVVFKAEDSQLRRLVALKAMLPVLAVTLTARQRFLREAQAAAAIQHDYVVPIYDVGEDNGVPYLAMPFLRGESLEARLRRLRGPLREPEVLRIGEQIAQGLAAIHELGLIHRDVKPANVWLETLPGALGSSSPRDRVKILDFGLARAVRNDARLTQEGSIVGSPAYMAPEQANRLAIDHRADLFSLGCVLYSMATGSLPFEGDDALTTLLAVTNAEPVPPCERNPQLSEQLSLLIMSLLAKKPADRPASARAIIESIRELMRQ